jgi:hypothetical protein
MLEFLHMKATLFLMAVLVAPVMGEDEAEDFVGAVIKRNGFSSGRGCVISENGGMAYSSSSGRSIISTDGFYYKSGKSFVGKDGAFISKSGNFFYGTSAILRDGSAYMNECSAFFGSSKDDD